MNESDTPMSMPWLAAAAEHRALWDDFVAELTNALGDLDDHTVVVVDVGTLSSDGSTWVPGRHLQYAVLQVDGDRAMIAEASGPEHLPDAVPQSDELSAAFSQKGWPLHRELLNHARVFVWPEQIGDAVQDSLDIVRDIWRTPSPTAVTIDKRRLAEPLGEWIGDGQSGAGGGEGLDVESGGSSGDAGSTDSDGLLCPDEPHPDAKFYYPRTPDDTLVQIEQWLTSDPDIEVDFGYDDEGRKTALAVGVPGRMSFFIMANSRFKEIRVEMVISEDPEVIAKATPEALGRIYSMGAAPGGIWVEDGSLMMGMSLAVTAMARDGISDQLSRFVSYRGVVEQLLIEGAEAGEADGTG